MSLHLGTLTLSLTKEFESRLFATAMREMTSVDTWAMVALSDCVNASEAGAVTGKREVAAVSRDRVEEALRLLDKAGVSPQALAHAHSLADGDVSKIHYHLAGRVSR